MEKLASVQLSSVQTTLLIGKKTEIIKTLAAYQKAWMSVTFKEYGSLYYVQDIAKRSDQAAFSYIDMDGTEIEDQGFTIGPTAHRQSIDYGRAKVYFDRGPCESTVIFQITNMN